MTESVPDEVHRLDREFPVSFSIYAMSRAQRPIAAGGLAGLGLFPGQEIMLMLLDTADGRSQKELAASLRITHVTVTKMIARLERSGLVERRRSDADRRVTFVFLTASGREVREGILRVWTELESITNRHLGDAERSAYLAAAAAIRRALDTTAAARGIGPAAPENEETP